jgi:hypothetical protein
MQKIHFLLNLCESLCLIAFYILAPCSQRFKDQDQDQDQIENL